MNLINALKAATSWQFQQKNDRCIQATSPITLNDEGERFQFNILTTDEKTLYLTDAGQANLQVAKNGLWVHPKMAAYINDNTRARLACIDVNNEVVSVCLNENLQTALWDVLKMALAVSSIRYSTPETNPENAQAVDQILALREFNQIKQRNQTLEGIKEDLTNDLRNLHKELTAILNRMTESQERTTLHALHQQLSSIRLTLDKL